MCRQPGKSHSTMHATKAGSCVAACRLLKSNPTPYRWAAPAERRTRWGRWGRRFIQPGQHLTSATDKAGPVAAQPQSGTRPPPARPWPGHPRQHDVIRGVFEPLLPASRRRSSAAFGRHCRARSRPDCACHGVRQQLCLMQCDGQGHCTPSQDRSSAGTD